MKRSSMRLRRDLREQVRTLLLLKTHHLKLAAAQDNQLASLFAVAYGIDITREDWELSPDLTTLTRKG